MTSTSRIQSSATNVAGSAINLSNKPVSGKYVTLRGETFYKICHYDRMAPFFMSIVSASNHWMFVSSLGGLTAGRSNPDHALFPYYNDDVIHDSHEITGSKTLIKVHVEDQSYLWEPFSSHYAGLYKIERNLYKNVPGNKLVFEETNHSLNLTFSYCWLSSERFGFIKYSSFSNQNDSAVKVEVLDGIQNLLPNGIDQHFQTEFSTLADGYKNSELIQAQQLGLYTLSSIPCDRAEPSESLRATIAWCRGLTCSHMLLSSNQLSAFRSGLPIQTETQTRATRGAFFGHAQIELNSGQEKAWFIAADIDQDATHVHQLLNEFDSEPNIFQVVMEDVEKGTQALIQTVASADGLQLTGNRLNASRHFSNVLFNTMRGGYFDQDYRIERQDFIGFLTETNRNVLKRNEAFLGDLPETVTLDEFTLAMKQRKDPHLRRLSLEYLPLTFSRRHGDPSRPWNRFSVDIMDERKRKIRNYQGNWRDIFQNWEALAESFPRYLPSMIVKFLNGSTADGFNPYRVTRSGFEWEVPEPGLAWANIGYWGDHQIIYLLKLLEACMKHDPSRLRSCTTEDLFGYLQVPYRLKPYQELLENPHNTIDFDDALHAQIMEAVKQSGSDACSFTLSGGEIYLVNLCEKLLVTLLSKLSHFVPDGGIWMNTQRPEWNDANNALVGYGLSMVTLYYTRRFILFFKELMITLEEEEVSISEEVMVLFDDIHKALEEMQPNLSPTIRHEIVDGLGLAGSRYRKKIYRKGFVGKRISVKVQTIVHFLDTARISLDHTISKNRRQDGLYHSYNLMDSSRNGEIRVEHLYEMLEGQVGILSSGFLNTAESIRLLGALRTSALYREDQNSYILYPNKTLPGFLEKNRVPCHLLESSPRLQELIDIDNHDIVLQDINGTVHFHPDMRNVGILKAKLKDLDCGGLLCITAEDIEQIAAIYEAVFQHRRFTGRSGTFFKYEGLGSIYWHMVSKLALAVQDCWYQGKKANAPMDELEKLKSIYYEIKSGIGAQKCPDQYGAFPTDPYSHTPEHAGVQQPGMTGQVKEDILARFGELGVRILNGCIHFSGELIQKDEFLNATKTFMYVDMNGHFNQLILQPGQLAFTLCKVPIVYSISKGKGIRIDINGGEPESHPQPILPKKWSEALFNRRGEIKAIWVDLPGKDMQT